MPGARLERVHVRAIVPRRRLQRTRYAQDHQSRVRHAGRRAGLSDRAVVAQRLAALPDAVRALWATAFYAGLRRGELQALRWGDVDLGRNLIGVTASWDQIAGLVEPKSRAGRRSVPIV